MKCFQDISCRGGRLRFSRLGTKELLSFSYIGNTQKKCPYFWNGNSSSLHLGSNVTKTILNTSGPKDVQWKSTHGTLNIHLDLFMSRENQQLRSQVLCIWSVSCATSRSCRGRGPPAQCLEMNKTLTLHNPGLKLTSLESRKCFWSLSLFQNENSAHLSWN